MKTKQVFLLILFFFAFSVSGALAADTERIGYVDLSRLFDQYEKTKEYDKVLEDVHQNYEQERNSKLERLKEAQGKIALLKTEEKEKLQVDLDKQRADLLEFDRQRQTDLRKQRDEKIREILLEIEEVVRDFAQKEKYSMILNDRVLIYGEDSVDVTDQILSILNAKYSKK